MQDAVSGSEERVRSTRDARVNQAYLRLYDGTAEQPHIPASVTFVETLAQIPVSAALIFLFLLAVKNRFKIKWPAGEAAAPPFNPRLLDIP
ncbi:MAG: hypothetical protein ACLPIX_01505 [Rhodomicrobium sp.]